MVIDVRAHLDLFDLDDFLLFLRLGLFLLLLVFELAEIEDLANGRLRARRNFHEIKPCFGGEFDRFGCWNDAAFFPVLIDQKDLRNPDFFIDAGAVAFWLRGGERSAGYRRFSFGGFRRKASTMPARGAMNR
jgi:hypothetical protein